MNIKFEAALKYIDLQNYDEAIKHLSEAIKEEENKDNEADAARYRCVLAELLANLGRKQEARAEFDKVFAYCNDSMTLPEQRSIAMAYIHDIDNNIPLPNEMAKRNGSLPIVEKPVQNKAFISQQMKKRRK